MARSDWRGKSDWQWDKLDLAGRTYGKPAGELNGLANSYLFSFAHDRLHRLSSAMAYGLAFQNSAANMLILPHKTCSDRRIFGLDFISHPEGFNAAAAPCCAKLLIWFDGWCSSSR